MSGYYRWAKTPITPHQQVNEELQKLIKQIYDQYNGRYGYRRITMVLRREHDRRVNLKRVLRLMRHLGLQAIIRRPRRGCTIVRGTNFFPNRLDRDFTASSPNEKWVTDVTYLTYGNGEKAYLSAIKDLYDGSIVDYNISQQNDNPLVLQNLEQAMAKNPNAHPLLHSDRGTQYTSKQYLRLTTEAGFTLSMSRVGKCIDNAPMESFWSHYKDEAYYDHKFETYEALVTSIKEYIAFYNHKRYQTKLGSLAPAEYRALAA